VRQAKSDADANGAAVVTYRQEPTTRAPVIALNKHRRFASDAPVPHNTDQPATDYFLQEFIDADDPMRSVRGITGGITLLEIYVI
jgi:hypothetical protein